MIENKVAVIVPTYKPGNYIEKCLRSIENQTLKKKNFCVYIALNGSSEKYKIYIEKILEDITFNFKFFYLEKAGVSNARNFLLDNSYEEYIVFLDDDDLISENYLENLLDVVKENYIGISNIYNFKKNLKKLEENYIGKTYKKLNGIETSKFKIRKYFSNPVAKIIHRKMIGKIRFDTKLKIGEDSLFMTMISKNIKGIMKTNENTCYYVYQREGSASRGKKREKTEKKYLLKIFLKLIFNSKYDRIFILTRIVAILKSKRK